MHMTAAVSTHSLLPPQQTLPPPSVMEAALKGERELDMRHTYTHTTSLCTHTNKHTHARTRALNWRTLYDRRRLRRGIATYKSVNKLSPPYLHDIFTSNTNSKGLNKDNIFVIRPNTNWTHLLIDLPYFGTRNSVPEQLVQFLVLFIIFVNTKIFLVLFYFNFCKY